MRAEMAGDMHERDGEAEGSDVRDAPPAPRPVLPTLKQREDQYIRRVFKIMGGNIWRAAQVLGIGRATLYRRLYALGLLEHKSQRERIIEQRAKTEQKRMAKREAKRLEAERARYLERFKRPMTTL